MPGKVNPVIPEVVIQVAGQVIGNDAAITVGGMQGQFELNVRVPLIARNLLDSIKLLASASRLLDEKCVAGLEANEEMTDPPRRGHPGDGDRAQPPHRLRPRRRHRQGRGRVGPLPARGRARAGRRAGDPRGGAGPPPHGPAARVGPGVSIKLLAPIAGTTLIRVELSGVVPRTLSTIDAEARCAIVRERSISCGVSIVAPPRPRTEPASASSEPRRSTCGELGLR